MTKRKPCVGPHWFVVTVVNGVEHGVCKRCLVTRDFFPERTRLEMLKKNAVAR